MPVIQRDGKAVGTSPEVEGVKTLSGKLHELASRLKPDQKELHKELLQLVESAKEKDSQLSQAAEFAAKQDKEIKRLRSTGDDTSAAMIEDLQIEMAEYQQNTAQRLLGVAAYQGWPMTQAQALSICRHIPKA